MPSKEQELTRDQHSGAESDSLLPFWLAASAVLLAVAITCALLVQLFDEWSTRGQFGDMFGVLNTTFSGLAFSALVYTLLLQRRELRLQRVELAMTRAELSKQAQAQKEHAETALRAARISALGSLYQGYAVLIGNGRAGLIGGGPSEEIGRVQAELKHLLESAP